MANSSRVSWRRLAETLNDTFHEGAFRLHAEKLGQPLANRLHLNTEPTALHAFARDAGLRELALDPGVAASLRAILGDDARLSQCHHNCVMTKFPGYSSATLWHQDIRYWSFDRPELVSAWFALGSESRRNGALRVIPGSHLTELDRGRLDRDLFLRTDLAENRELIHRAIPIELDAGDVLLFHCRLYHAAGKNLSDEVKLSPVFTYHAGDNHPIPGTRSSTLQSIELPQASEASGD